MKYLAIGSHGDDIELGCGGTLKKAINAGNEVLMLVMSKGGFKDYKKNQIRTRKANILEAKNAAKSIGAKIKLLDFSTKDIPYDSKSVEAINKVLDEYKPDYIFTQWTFDTHQDHRNTALATISAARNFENIFMYEPFPPSGRSYVGFKPQVYVDISDVIDDKITAIECHVGEARRYGPEWTESVRARAKLRGFECNVKYAETFELLRMTFSI